jgi:hypothetical protein
MQQATIILDPIPRQASSSQHDQRLEEILNESPPSTQQAQKTFADNAKSFCASRIGLALLSGVVFFFLLLILQPTYIFKKNKENNSFGFKDINYLLVFIISAIGSLCVGLIPFAINKTSS